MGKILEDNYAKIIGAIAEEIVFSHESHGEKFYSTRLACHRFSGVEDLVPVIISERLIDVSTLSEAQIVKIEGTVRSYYKKTEHGNYLTVFVFAGSIETEISKEEAKSVGVNTICISGNVCGRPTYRGTPKGRDIADFTCAVNRPYSKSDYIPCICWGRNARYASGFQKGVYISVKGRFQSREYVKRFEDGTVETRIAYEVSVSEICVSQENGGNDAADDSETGGIAE